MTQCTARHFGISAPPRVRHAFAVAAILLSAVCVYSAAAEAQAKPTTPGWALHYYGSTTFWHHGGTTTTASAAISFNGRQQKWPRNNRDAARGPVFWRNSWSVAAYAELEVPTAGEYRFATRLVAENGQVHLCVNGVEIDSEHCPTVILPVGQVPVAVYIKPRRKLDWGKSEEHCFKLELLWQPPGATEMIPVPGDRISHTQADLERKHVYQPDILLRYDDGVEHRLAERRFTIEIPDDGFYEIVAHLGSTGRRFQVWLDDQPVLYVQGQRGTGVSDPVYGADAAAGYTDRQRLDFLHRARAVRPLRKGTHTVDVYAHYGPWIWEDEMPTAMSNSRIGLTRLGRNSFSPGAYVKDRDDMVLRMNESLVVAVVAPPATAERTYHCEIREQRGDGTLLWQGETSVPANPEWTQAEIRYPCDREGTFEYTVFDADGRAIDGPWAFVVVDPTPLPRPRAKPGMALDGYAKVLVDSVDCTQAENTGHKFRDNGTSRVVEGPDGRYRVTGEAKKHSVGYIKDAGTWRRTTEGEKPQAKFWAVDWFAYTLKVKNPGKPHLVVAQVPNDIRRLVSMCAIDPVTGNYNGWVLDAGDAPAAGPFSPLSFVAWPNCESLAIMVWCSNGSHHGKGENRQGAVAKIELFELPKGLPALPEAADGWAATPEFGWTGEQVDLGPVERTMPSLWPGNDPIPGQLPHYAKGQYRDWKALQTVWERFGEFSAYRGDNLFVYPVFSYNMNFLQGEAARLLPKAWDVYSKGYRARVVDPMDRDTFKLMLLTAEKYDLKLVADFMVQTGVKLIAGWLAERAGVEPSGLLLTDDSGKPARAPSTTPLLNPVHPVVRQYLVELMDVLGARYGAYPAFAGVRLRHWKWASGLDGWFMNDQLGYDDFTVELFSRETGIAVPVTATDAGRFKARREYLLKEQRDAWLDWRCRKVFTLKEEMLAALRQHSPEARLFSDAMLNRRAGLDPKLLAGRRDLGWGSTTKKFGGPGVEWNHPDPVAFANFDVREPASLRRTLQDILPHAHGRSYPLGMCCNQSYRSHPYQLQGPAQALAAGQFQTFTYGGQWCLPPADEGLRRFVQAWRAIPDLEFRKLDNPPKRLGGDDPVVCHLATDKDDVTSAYFVNTTDRAQPFTILCNDGQGTARNLVTGLDSRYSRGRIDAELAPYDLLVLTFSSGDRPTRLLFPEPEGELPSLEGKRITLTIDNPGALARDNGLVVIPGRELLGHLRADAAPIPTPRLQVRVNGKPIPTQVDERDQTSDYVEHPNKTLDANDEIVCQLSFAAGQQSRAIEIGLRAADTTAPDAPAFSVSQNDKPTADRPWRLLVENSTGKFGFGSGGLSFLQADQRVLHRAMRAHNFDSALMGVGRAWPGGFHSPRVVVNGPVRYLVEYTSKKPVSIDWATDGGNRHFWDGQMNGVILTRRFEMIAGQSALRHHYRFDYEEDLAGGLTFTPIHWFTPGMQIYGGGDLADKLLVSTWRGQLKTATAQGDALNIPESDGWQAVWDRKLKYGLAIVAEPRHASFSHHKHGVLICRKDGGPLGRPIELDIWMLPLSDGTPENILNRRQAVLEPLRVRPRNVE